VNGERDPPATTSADRSAADRSGTEAETGVGDDTDGGDRRPIHVTSALLDVLLDMSEAAEPDPISVVLTPTPASAFDADLGLDPETPVLTHFYLPEAGRSVTAVFGLDLSTPAGRGRARFHAHPQGPREPTKRDDFAAAVLVAVPPWEPAEVRAYDRSGTRLVIETIDAVPPEETLEDARRS
jgi:hypothetical protein